MTAVKNISYYAHCIFLIIGLKPPITTDGFLCKFYNIDMKWIVLVNPDGE